MGDVAQLKDLYELDIDRGFPSPVPWLRKDVIGVAVLLHGGAGGPPTHKLTDISYNRMTTFRMHIAASFMARVPVVQVYNKSRGWASRNSDGLGVARAVVDDVAEQFPEVPIVLVGHSSGGYAALNIADHERVTGVVALAPWLTTSRAPVAQLANRQVLVLHGTADWITSPRMSRSFVRRAQAAGHDARYVSIRNGDHDMFRNPMQWHTLTTEHVRHCVGL